MKEKAKNPLDWPKENKLALPFFIIYFFRRAQTIFSFKKANQACFYALFFHRPIGKLIAIKTHIF